MARKKQAITMYRGDSYPITLTLTVALTDNASSIPVDLTGCSLVLTVDSLEFPPDDTTKLFEVAGVLDADPTTGKATFTPTSANNATPGGYYYDVQLTDADGNIRTVIKSTYTITQDITK